MFRNRTLILGNEDELSVVMDYVLYHYRRGGKAVIERFAEQSPQDSTEQALLEAMLKARYSLCRVEEIHPGYGAAMQDILCNARVELVDVGISQSAVPGLILAGHFLPIADFVMTSGAAMPLLQELIRESILPIVRKFLLNARNFFSTPGDLNPIPFPVARKPPSRPRSSVSP